MNLLHRSAAILAPLPGAYLAGGTALSLYLAHRLSVVLDFFVPQGFLARDLRPRIMEAGAFGPISVSDDSIVCTIDEVQWSLFKYDYALLEGAGLFAGVQVASIRDIAAMKVAAIGDRGSRKDFYDLYAILRTGDFDIRRILEDLVLKFRLRPDNVYHYVKALSYFEDAVRAPDIRDTLRLDVHWSDVELFFRRLAKTLIP